MENIWQVGITGGMGAGKSLVCRIFSVLDIPIYDADSQAKYLMQNDPRLKQELVDLLGANTYDPDGKLDRGFVASRIFSDEFLLQSLNALVHPAVHRDASRWHQEQSNVPYTLKEAALTFESGSYLQLDFVINVECPEDIRIARIKERDHLSDEEIQARLKRQWTEKQRRDLADFTIVNDGKCLLIPQVMQIHAELA